MVFIEYALKAIQTIQFWGEQEYPLIVSKLIRVNVFWGTMGMVRFTSQKEPGRCSLDLLSDFLH